MDGSRPLLILASTSERRIDLLSSLGLEFETRDPGVDEEGVLGPTPEATATERANRKARAVATLEPEARVLGADTVVALDGEILGKAAEDEEVREMLGRLSGRDHEVITAIALMEPEADDTHTSVSSATVTFRNLSDVEVEWYVSTGEGVGKAGGYAIQGLGGILVKALDGDREAVIGLHTSGVIELLEG
jgi:septum formation protein